MSGALSFSSADELVSQVKAVDWAARIEGIHADPSREDLGPLTAVYSSVGSSTFRAFRVYKSRRPSDVFRSCVSRELLEGGFAEFRDIRTNAAYRTWAFYLAKKLQQAWQQELKTKLDLARALKLVNLLAKGLCTVSPIWPTLSETIARFIDVPLDKYSLRPLACVEGLGRLRKASMGSVEDATDYKKIQQTILDLCQKAGKPPIAYDFMAWDGTHPKRR